MFSFRKPYWLALLLANTLPVYAQQPPSSALSITPPAVLSRVEASYPAGASASAEVLVVLRVQINAAGQPLYSEIVASGGAAFDSAAQNAVMLWKFQPAMQGQTAVQSSLQIPFRFVRPAASIPAPLNAASEEELMIVEEEEEVTVTAKRVPPARSVSDFVIENEVLSIAPKQTAEDLLSSAPGVYISKNEGDAVAGEVFLRGFDAEHGQDIEFTIGDIPINQPSHLHGQGYADLNILIPEVVQNLRVTEGVYDPRQGDFAVAGSMNFDLGVEERGYRLSFTNGTFGSKRQLLLWAPKNEATETFGAVSISSTEGFGENRGASAGTAIGQYAFETTKGSKGLLQIFAYGGRANFAGVLRQDDIDAGLVDFYGVYNDPSATSQSAFSTRSMAAFRLENEGENGARGLFSFWLSIADFRLRENFTGYLERSQQNPEFAGRGDLIEQNNLDFSLGSKLYRRSENLTPMPSMIGNLELGMSFRSNFIEQVQNLLQQPQNEIWDQRVDASIRGADIGTYLDADFMFGKNLHLRGGYRADVLYYNVNDRLGNFIPQFGIEDHILGFRRSALGVAAGPRATIDYHLSDALRLLLSYGEGYRSPQARILGEGENAPFAKVRSLETGARYIPWEDERLSLTGSLYATYLSADLAFDPGEGGLEPIGPTRRLGGVLQLLAKPTDYALLSFSATYVHATLEEPPTPTADNPIPPFEPGQLLPDVPPLVLRGDLGLHKDKIVFQNLTPFSASIGLGSSFLSTRPLAYSDSSAAVFLLDAQARLRSGAFELSFEGYNLLNNQYAASELTFVSDWGTSEIPSRVPAKHIVAGAPFRLMTTLKVYF